METMSQSSWRKNLRRGAIGEAIVDRWMHRRGLMPYAPGMGGAHAFDRVYCSLSGENIIAADVKTKPRRLRYPDTGIDVHCYERYKRVRESLGVPIWLFFVDAEATQSIYGGVLSRLEQPMRVCGVPFDYPTEYGGVIYFPLCNMIELYKLSNDDVRSLIESTRSYSYM